MSKYSKSSKTTKSSTTTTTTTVKTTSGTGGGGTGGGSVSVTKDVPAGSGNQNSIKDDSINVNYKPAKHFYVTPMSSRSNQYHADTAIIAPYRTYLGSIGPAASPDGSVSNDVNDGLFLKTQGFAEVVGILPTGILKAGSDQILTGDALLNKIRSVTYDYRPGGHKIISIQYETGSSGTWREDLHSIRFNVLFSDGSHKEICQYIVHNSVAEKIPLRTQDSDSVFKPLEKDSNYGAHGLTWDVKGPINARDRHIFISAGAWIRSNSKGGIPAQGLKHEFWRIDDKPLTWGKLSAVFHQQAYDTYPSQCGDIAEGVDESSKFMWDWDRRNNPTHPNSFAAKTGADGFTYSAANVAVGSALYDTVSGVKYNNQGVFTEGNLNSGSINWCKVNDQGKFNSAETFSSFSQYPSNRFSPINSQYGAGIGTTIMHDGMCIRVLSLNGQNLYQSLGGNPSGEKDVKQITLALRSLYKGQYLQPEETNLEPYNGGIIPASDSVGINSALFNNGAQGINISHTGSGGGNEGHAGGSRDVFVNLLIGKRDKFFKSGNTAAAGVSPIQNQAFAACMGKKYAGNVSEGNKQVYSDQILNVEGNGTFDQFGLILPYSKQEGLAEVGHAFGVESNLQPTNIEAYFVTNVAVTFVPFYSHIDFPVLNKSSYPGVNGDDTGTLYQSDVLTEFDSAQGVSDYVTTKQYKNGNNVVVNSIPTLLNVAQFDEVPFGYSPSHVNLDPNTTLTLDNKHSIGYNASINAHTIGYDRDTRQPWGRVNSVYNVSDTSYAAGRTDLSKMRTFITLYPKSTLTNPAGVEAANPELTFLQTNIYNSSATLPSISIDGVDTSTGFNGGTIQFQTNLSAAGVVTGGSLPVDANAYNIYDWKYTPGRHLLDGSLYPINTDNTTDNEVLGLADFNVPTILFNQTTVQETEFRLLGEINDTTTDRPFIDLDVEDIAVEQFNLQNDNGVVFNAVSSIKISKTVDHIGGVLSGAAGIGDWSREYEFVVFGQTEYENPIVVEEIAGCTDPKANNYNPEATVDDGGCIYCADTLPSSAVDPHQFLPYGITPSVIDAPPVGNGSAYGGLNTSNEEWVVGNIGNAVNYSPPNEGIAGDNPGGTAQFTSFQFQALVNTNAIVSAANNGGTSIDNGEWLNYWNDNVADDAYTLLIYDIDAFDYDQYAWGNQGAGGNVYTTLPINEGYSTVNVLLNNGTAQNLSFGTNFPGDLGNTTLGLQAGKQYLAVLAINPKQCNITYYLPYNFWVLYCDCDVFSADNWAGDDFSYPWSGSNAFPAGYSQDPYAFCQSNILSSRTWKKSKGTNDQDGLCVFPPDFVDCTNFIDFCITSTSFDCDLIGNVTDGFTNIGSGQIAVNVFGVYTGSDILGQEYALVTDGQLFQFEIEIFPATGGSAIASIQVTTVEDYMNLSGGVEPQNLNAVNILFDNIPQGQYYIYLNQLGSPFPSQDPTLPVCNNITPDGSDGGLVSVGIGEECPEFIAGCNDEEATNYNPNATTEYNDGTPFDLYNDTCIYEDCTNVFEATVVTAISITNSEAECAEELVDDGTGTLVAENFLQDTAVGGASFTVDADPDGNGISPDFNIGIVSMISGNQSVGTETLLTLYQQQSATILSSEATDPPVPATQDGVVIGGFLATNVTTVPQGMFSPNGMYAGNYLVVCIPHSVATLVDLTLVECLDQLVEFLDQLQTFTINLNTTNIPNGSCNEPCNEVLNPEDCDDFLPGCTDESATNYNASANYDDGSCEYSGTETCITNPELPECQECEDEETGGLKICDETFGNEEGCGDPEACNYNADAQVFVPGLCEYCSCAPDSELCVDNEDNDECEDELGNVDPDCDTPECPDPTNPDCDTVVINPCPTDADCPPPPVPDCIQLGTCGDDDPTEDPDVIIDDVIVEEISCDPMFNGQSFDTWRTEAMTCSATEGSKMLFKLRSGVKNASEQDLIKLTLINYLFNQGLDLSCLFSCDAYDTKTLRNKYQERNCRDDWARGGSKRWTPKSTYSAGETVRVVRNVRGVTKASYHIAKKDVPAQQISPTTKTTSNEFWVRCKTIRGQKLNNESGQTYLRTLYEFMIKFCQNCTIVNDPGPSLPDRNNTKPIQSNTGIIGSDDNEIIF